MPGIREAAEKLSENQKNAQNLKSKFEDVTEIETDATVKEDFLSKEIKPVEPETVAGIDGGLLKKRYSSGDIVCVRAVAAVFKFEKLSFSSASYIPGSSPEPEYFVFNADSSDSLERNAARERLKAETSVALEATSPCKQAVTLMLLLSELQEWVILWSPP
jgi:hypothetical protein